MRFHFYVIFFVMAGLSVHTSGQNDQMQNLKLFLGGDVMLGRGIDQAFPVSVNPILYEPYVKNAKQYIDLAERENGPLPRPLEYNYLWGDALKIWRKEEPDLKLINLETSITTHHEPWPGKAIHYKMHPKNVKALVTAQIDYCSLANNHVLDWGRPGLIQTLTTLDKNAMRYSGAGLDRSKARAPAEFFRKGRRILIFSYGFRNSGIPPTWKALDDLSGLNYLPSMGKESLQIIKGNVRKYKTSGDLIILSVHWGGNWGYDISDQWRGFAHDLIDEAEIDLIVGHSSHHPMGIEVYNNKLILYGAGDFINDYEGIGGYEQYRSDLTLMYFPELNEEGNLSALKMIPLKIRNFQLQKAKSREVIWLKNMLNREGKSLGTAVESEDDGVLYLRWRE